MRQLVVGQLKDLNCKHSLGETKKAPYHGTLMVQNTYGMQRLPVPVRYPGLRRGGRRFV